MSHIPHDLQNQFPDDAEALHRLKLGDAHFKRRADAYHDLNREIHRIDSGVEAASDDRMEALKKARLALLDEISAMISATKHESMK